MGALLESLTPPYGFNNFDITSADPEQPVDNNLVLGLMLNPLALMNGESTIKLQRAALAPDIRPGLIPIGSPVSVSSGTRCAITSGIDGTFNSYRVVLSGGIVAVGADLIMELSQDAGVSWLSTLKYAYNGYYSRSNTGGGASANGSSGAASFKTGALSAMTPATPYFGGLVRFVNPAGTTNAAEKQFFWDIVGNEVTYNKSWLTHGSGFNFDNSNPFDGVSFRSSSGNITLTAQLYGEY